MTDDVGKLLPCPFCGMGAEAATGKNADGSDWDYIQCQNFGCQAIASTEAWGRRVDSRLPSEEESKMDKAEIKKVLDELREAETEHPYLHGELCGSAADIIEELMNEIERLKAPR